jgi:alkylation response protein AidB-like acyl-CoA dehydrogenase
MDLELNDEQRWLSEAVDTLLAREAQPWDRLVEFGALSVGGDDGLGAVELCLIARALGAHLAPVPYLDSAAVRFSGVADLGEAAVALAVLEPGASWAAPPSQTTLAGQALSGRKTAVEHAGAVARLAVVAAAPEGPVLAVVDAGAPGVTWVAQPTLDPTAPVRAVELEDVPVVIDPLGGDAIDRLATIGALLAAAEAVGAAGRMLDDACRYASERRQFGRRIAGFQALRHLLADVYVRHASSWSSVLYAAAALDENAIDADRTVSVAKAYVSRAAREVAHGAIQVFGGIAMTAEHPAHRYLRRIIVRGRRFGDAAHHERALGRALAAAIPEPVS